jgi:hypothetical protein
LEGDDPSLVLDAALDLACTQLLAQNDDEASLDGRTMGLVAFNGTLLAANLGANELLGAWWFVPLIATAMSTLLCLALATRRGGDFGPAAGGFYSAYATAPALAAREQLLADLDRTFQRNARRIDAKQRGIRSALGVLLVGVLLSGFLLARAPVIRI